MPSLTSVLIGGCIVAGLAFLYFYMFRPSRNNGALLSSKTAENAAGGGWPHTAPAPLLSVAVEHPPPPLPPPSALHEESATAPSKPEPPAATRTVPETEHRAHIAQIRLFLDQYTKQLARKSQLHCHDIQVAYDWYMDNKAVHGWHVEEDQMTALIKEAAWRNLSIFQLMRVRKLGMEFAASGNSCKR